MTDASVLDSFAGKTAVVTGGTGLIGRQVATILCDAGAHVRIVSLDDIQVHPAAEHVIGDLTDFALCKELTSDADFVFHIAGVKGSIEVTRSRPASFFVPLLMMNTNVLEACRLNGVSKVLYASSIGAYASGEVFVESEGREGEPMDIYPGWAKRVAEMQVETYRIQYGLENYAIVRPCNVYGPGDNFDPTLREEAADFVCDGEGPYTLVDLIDALKGGRREDLAKVRGLRYWDGNEVASGPPAPNMANLDDEAPELAWDLLPMDKYRAHNWHTFGGLAREPYGSLYTSLGCPYHCTFCCIQAPFKSGEKEMGFGEKVNSYRMWSVEAIVAQVDKLVNTYGVKNIKIADEVFVLNRRHVEGICDALIERDYDLNIWAYARVDTIKEGMAPKLRAAGVRWLAFGIEAANDRVRDDVQKGVDQEIIYKTVQEVRSEGIDVAANFIFGLPEDDHATMQETLDMALDLNCEMANFYCTMAYPGSALYNEALGRGWELPSTWSGYSQHSRDTLPLPTKHISGPEVLKFRDEAFQRYFDSPTYLEMINNRYGPETVKEIQEMTSIRLVREQY